MWCRRYLLVLLSLFLPMLGVSADEGSIPSEGRLIDALEQVNVCVFQVAGGSLRTRMVSGSDLLKDPDLDLHGHIAGLLVLSPEPVAIHLDGQPLGSVRPDKDGVFHLKHYGRFLPQDIEAAFSQEGRTDFDIESLRDYSGCQAAFAPVPGNALSSRDSLTIALSKSGEHFSARIHQTGARRLDEVDPELAAGEGPKFSYLGEDGARFRADASARTRLAAIAAGIRHIEEMVGDQLVSTVHLIDFKGRNNALTRNGFDEIWLYSDTFWKESPEELRTMIEHETLHLLADRCRFAQQGAIRELFADLRGLESLSKERFSLITMGILPATAAARSASRDSTLLAFINEMNFFKGMKGGHSRDNLDEFLASFLHTLVFIQDLERAVHAPVLFPDRFTRHLGAYERKCLLEDYVRVIYALEAALKDDSEVRRFLRKCLEHAARLQERLPLEKS